MNKSRLITVGTAAAALALTAGAASATTTFITSADIKDGAVHKVDLTDKINRDLLKAEAPGTARSAADNSPPEEDSATATVSPRAFNSIPTRSATGSRTSIHNPFGSTG